SRRIRPPRSPANRAAAAVRRAKLATRSKRSHSVVTSREPGERSSGSWRFGARCGSRDGRKRRRAVPAHAAPRGGARGRGRFSAPPRHRVLAPLSLLLAAPVRAAAAAEDPAAKLLATTPADSLPAALQRIETDRSRPITGAQAALTLGQLYFARAEY